MAVSTVHKESKIGFDSFLSRTAQTFPSYLRPRAGPLLSPFLENSTRCNSRAESQRLCWGTNSGKEGRSCELMTDPALEPIHLSNCVVCISWIIKVDECCREAEEA